MVQQSEAAPHTAITKPGIGPIPLGETVAILNQKGGQGKTTTTAETGAELAANGVQVRAIDADGQDGGLSVLLPPQWHDVPLEERWELADVLSGRCTLDQATWPTVIPGLYVVPASEAVKRFGRDPGDPGREWTLNEAISTSKRIFGATLIDCPPNLGDVTLTALVAATNIIIPVKAGGLDLKGVSQLNRILILVRQRMRSDQVVRALIITSRENNTLTDQIIDRLLDDYPDALHGAVRKTVRVAESSLAEEPAALYAPQCTAVADYQEITRALFAPALEAAA